MSPTICLTRKLESNNTNPWWSPLWQYVIQTENQGVCLLIYSWWTYSQMSIWMIWYDMIWDDKVSVRRGVFGIGNRNTSLPTMYVVPVVCGLFKRQLSNHNLRHNPYVCSYNCNTVFHIVLYLFPVLCCYVCIVPCRTVLNDVLHNKAITYDMTWYYIVMCYV